MAVSGNHVKVGVFADVPNMYHTGGQRLQYDVLREFACRDNAEPSRLNAYVTFDVDRAQRDPVYREGATNFHAKLRDYGFKVVLKEVRSTEDDPHSPSMQGGTGAQIDLAIDALLASEHLDRIVIASGDGDLVRLVKAIQSRGCRAEVVGLDNAALALRQEADFFISGFMVPSMVPIDNRQPKRQNWGEPGSRVRGQCYWYEPERGFGYMRFLKSIQPGLWITDARHPDSPYDTAFFPVAQLPQSIRPSSLPSRNYVFEFELAPSERSEGMQAIDIEAVSAPA